MKKANKVKFGAVLAGAGMAVLVVPVVVGLGGAVADNVPFSVNVDTNNQSISVSAATVSLSMDPASAALKTGSVNVTVGSGNETGYRLQVSANGTDLTMQGADAGDSVIPTLPTQAGGYAADVFPANRWGYRVGDTGNYFAFPETTGTGNAPLEIASSTSKTNADTTKFTFAAKADYLTAPGTYGLSLNFQVTPYVTKTYIQDVDLASCPEESTTVYDIRDENDYTIRKINGACWMTSNLRYVGDTGSSAGSMTIKSATTNIDADTSLTYYSLASSDSSYTDHCNSTNGYTYPCAKAGKDDNNNDTVWYNYAAASAGTITGSSNYTSATQDICPKGWKLPTGNSSAAGGIDGITSYKDAFSPVYGGYYYNGSLDNASTFGYWWSATANVDTTRYLLYYYSGSLHTNNYARYNGLYVRCVRTS